MADTSDPAQKQLLVEHYDEFRRIARGVLNGDADRMVLGKATAHQKIDLAMADALAHEAACDARAAGLNERRSRRMLVY